MVTEMLPTENIDIIGEDHVCFRRISGARYFFDHSQIKRQKDPAMVTGNIQLQLQLEKLRMLRKIKLKVYI